MSLCRPLLADKRHFIPNTSLTSSHCVLNPETNAAYLYDGYEKKTNDAKQGDVQREHQYNFAAIFALNRFVNNHIRSTSSVLIKKSSLIFSRGAGTAQRGLLLPADARHWCSHPLKTLQSQRIARRREGGAYLPPSPSLLQAPLWHRVPLTRRRRPEQHTVPELSTTQVDRG